MAISNIKIAPDCRSAYAISHRQQISRFANLFHCSKLVPKRLLNRQFPLTFSTQSASII